jgi:hypothetical protein
MIIKGEQMKEMTPEEAKAMVGTEFTYGYSDGDTIQAYVKKFDPEIGLTCISLETESKDGWTGAPGTHHEADGTFCVIGLNFKQQGTNHSVEAALLILETIRDKGYFSFNSGSLFGGGASCAFM